MMTVEFNKLLKALAQLTDQQTKRVAKALKNYNPNQIIINTLEQRLVTNSESQYCHCDQIKRNRKLNLMRTLL
jgi:hypothetical protein